MYRDHYSRLTMSSRQTHPKENWLRLDSHNPKSSLELSIHKRSQYPEFRGFDYMD